MADEIEANAEHSSYSEVNIIYQQCVLFHHVAVIVLVFVLDGNEILALHYVLATPF